MSSFAISFLSIFVLFTLNSINVVRAEVRSNSRCQDVSLECEYRENYCSVPAYAGLMFKICRFTCDWCQKSLNDVIHRRSFNAIPGIPEWQTVSPSSPEDVEGSGNNGSPSSLCVDHSKSCLTTASLCQSPNYQSIMASKCPKTCGVCE